MSITTWKDLMLPRLPGALSNVVEGEITQTVYNFCRESTAWRDMIYAVDIDINDREVELTYGDGTEANVSGVLRVYYSNKQLSQYSHAPWETSSSAPMGFTSKPDDPSVIVLSTIPSTAITGALDAYVYLEPVNPTDALPSVILNEFWEIVFDGALGRMYSHPEKPYTNPTLAQYHLRRYRNGTRRARDQANRGFTGNAQNWVFPSFGR